MWYILNLFRLKSKTARYTPAEEADFKRFQAETRRVYKKLFGVRPTFFHHAK